MEDGAPLNGWAPEDVSVALRPPREGAAPRKAGLDELFGFEPSGHGRVARYRLAQSYDIRVMGLHPTSPALKVEPHQLFVILMRPDQRSHS